MVARSVILDESLELVEQHLPLARMIALRLKRRYTWLDIDDLYSYCLFGLTVAAKRWESGRGVSFIAFAGHKAMYLAIDEMRRDRVLSRRDCRQVKPMRIQRVQGDDNEAAIEIVDPNGQKAEERLVIRDQLEHLLRGLQGEDRQLLELYYAEDLTMAEIGQVMGLSQSAVCVRHSLLLQRLRRRTRRMNEVKGHKEGREQ